MSSSGLSLAGAIHASDASPAKLLERLQKLVPDGTQWTSPPLTALRASLAPSSERSAERVEAKPTQSDIVKGLSDSDPKKRAEALAAAGYHQFVDLYDRVLDVAAHGAGVERDAAVYALAFYGRDVPEALLRQLMASDDPDIRLSGLDLATRRNPARLARESMDLVRSVVRQSHTGQQPDPGQPSYADAVPRLLSRLARGPLPAALLEGLADPEPQVRRIVIEALALSGNPDAGLALKPLTEDRDITTRAAARKAIRSLGPIDR